MLLKYCFCYVIVMLCVCFVVANVKNIKMLLNVENSVVNVVMDTVASH